MTTLDCALKGVYARKHIKKTQNDDKNLIRMLETLGNPHRRMPPCFHITGTNGKGSTCAFLVSIGKALGLKVHAFTSPHLVHCRERIYLASTGYIQDYMFLDILELIEKKEKELFSDFSFSFHDILMLVGFLAFVRIKADMLVLEVGIGGRLDATNKICIKNKINLFTKIGLDHVPMLGNSIEEIAHEKSYIIQDSQIAISLAQNTSVHNIINKRVQNTYSKLFIENTNFFIKITGSTWCYQDAYGTLQLPYPSLQGEHQIFNAGLAIAAIRHSIFMPYTYKTHFSFSHSIKSVRWPGRFQRLDKPFFCFKNPWIHSIYLDGAHNPLGAYALSNEMKKIYSRTKKKFFIIIGMLKSKINFHEFLSYFSPEFVSGIACIPIPLHEEDSLHPNILSKIATCNGLHSFAFGEFSHACCFLDKKIKENEVVFITGSLYLIGFFIKNNKLITQEKYNE